MAENEPQELYLCRLPVRLFLQSTAHSFTSGLEPLTSVSNSDALRLHLRHILIRTTIKSGCSERSAPSCPSDAIFILIAEAASKVFYIWPSFVVSHWGKVPSSDRRSRCQSPARMSSSAIWRMKHSCRTRMEW